MDGIGSDDYSGEPDCPIDVVNCGVEKELLDPATVKSLNNYLANIQFLDLKPRFGTNSPSFYMVNIQKS